MDPHFAIAETPLHVVALGDSLTAGFGLAAKDGFVPRLQAALVAQGAKVEIADGGVSGDTAADGLARLDWSVPESGRSNPVITINSVDLPEPEGPSRATASPRPI